MREIKDHVIKIAEFSYKMLQNILCNNAFLIKLGKDVNEYCSLCNTIERTRHLLFGCINIVNFLKLHVLSIA